MTELTPEEIADGLLSASLPRAAWTHAGHVMAAHALCRRHGAAAALELVRSAIPRLNEAHGVENTDGGGYHETLTVFYVAAVADCVAAGLDERATLQALPRDAPLSFWTKKALYSVAARRAFVAPDRRAPAFLVDLIAAPDAVADSVPFQVPGAISSITFPSGSSQ